jgi:hypothetical protein
MALADARGDLLDLLAARGWARIGTGAEGTLWQSPDELATVAVPNRVTPDSYEWPGIIERVASGLRLDRRATAELIVMRFTDITELVADTAGDGSSVPLTTGVALVESAQILVRTCSTSSRTERLSIDGHYLRSGDELAAKARMAHTREGSYVLPILMPLPRPEPALVDVPTLFEGATESDERRMTRTMAQTLTAIDSQILEPGRAPDTDALGNLLLAGATREAVVAVGRILSAPAVDGLRARFVWASGQPGPSFLPPDVFIPAEAAALLSESAQRMRKTPHSPTERFTGPIVQMRDTHDDRGGMVRIDTVRRGRPVEIEVTVPSRSIDETHFWFRDNETMVVSGTVQGGRGKRLRILEPTTFSRVADTQIF